jgi:hypothetical protein
MDSTIIGVCLVMAGLVCSAELFRRGVWADDHEVEHVAEHGDNSNFLLVLMIVFAVVGYMVANGGH